MVACLFAVLLFRDCSREADFLGMHEALNRSDSNLQRWQAASGAMYTQNEALIMSNQQLKQSNSQLSKSIKKDIGRQNKLISSIGFQVFETHDTMLISSDTVIIQNSMERPAKTVSYYDNWLQFEGVAIGDSFWVNYQAKNSMRLNTYWKRQGLFKPRVLVAQLKTDNPRMDVTTLQPIYIQDKKKWWERRGVLFAAGVFAGIGTALYLR